MQFDDRLKTVMMQPVEDSHDRTIRWRQLVDLMSRMSKTDDGGLVEAALALVRKERDQIPDAARAATARSIAGRSMDPRLISIFAGDKLAIAAPLLAASTLDEAGWAMVEDNASHDVTSLLVSLGRETGIPPAFDGQVKDDVGSSTEEENMLADEAIFLDPAESVEPSEFDSEVPPSIGEMVARIERLRHQRGPAVGDIEDVQTEIAHVEVNEIADAEISDAVGGQDIEEPAAIAEDANRPEQGDWSDFEEEEVVAADDVALFRWECDSAGQIAWVDGVPRGPLVGRNLTDETEGDRDLQRAIDERSPFDGAMLTLAEPKVKGEWRLSGIPAFSPRDGRFLGYRGIARKEVEVIAVVPEARARRSRVNRDLDALRETIHEIKTPLNAIIGFAEIIDGQYLGPAHRNYRLRAAEIVGQARTLMSAIEDLDFAARVQAELSSERQSTRVVDLLGDIQRDLEQRAAMAGMSLNFAVNPDARVAAGAELTGRLIRRFLTAVVSTGEAGERFDIQIDRDADRVIRIAIGRPMVTVGLDAESLLDPSYVASDKHAPGILGLGFALRMVRGLARMVGGEVAINPAELIVFLPEGHS